MKRVREILKRGKGRNIRRVLEELIPALRGWTSYLNLVLRSLTRLADTAPGIVMSRTEEWVKVPLGTLGLFWIKLFRPLLIDRDLRQAPGKKAMALLTMISIV